MKRHLSCEWDERLLLGTRPSKAFSAAAGRPINGGLETATTLWEKDNQRRRSHASVAYFVVASSSAACKTPISILLPSTSPLSSTICAKIRSKPLIQIFALNTSLMEQTAACFALGGSRNFSAVLDHIGNDRVGETSLRQFRRVRFSENGERFRFRAMRRLEPRARVGKLSSMAERRCHRSIRS